MSGTSRPKPMLHGLCIGGPADGKQRSFDGGKILQFLEHNFPAMADWKPAPPGTLPQAAAGMSRVHLYHHEIFQAKNKIEGMWRHESLTLEEAMSMLFANYRSPIDEEREVLRLRQYVKRLEGMVRLDGLQRGRPLDEINADLESMR